MFLSTIIGQKWPDWPTKSMQMGIFHLEKQTSGLLSLK